MSFHTIISGTVVQVLWHPTEILKDAIKQLRMVLERIMMAQGQIQEKQPQEAQLQMPQAPELCDSCSARALVKSSFEFGTLYFCLHHYNKNATALRAKGSAIDHIYDMRVENE
jgi:hypothetical protein